jgi:hypothetical protein
MDAGDFAMAERHNQLGGASNYAVLAGGGARIAAGTRLGCRDGPDLRGAAFANAGSRPVFLNFRETAA